MDYQEAIETLRAISGLFGLCVLTNGEVPTGVKQMSNKVNEAVDVAIDCIRLVNQTCEIEEGGKNEKD